TVTVGSPPTARPNVTYGGSPTTGQNSALADGGSCGGALGLTAEAQDHQRTVVIGSGAAGVGGDGGQQAVTDHRCGGSRSGQCFLQAGVAERFTARVLRLDEAVGQPHQD